MTELRGRSYSVVRSFVWAWVVARVIRAIWEDGYAAGRLRGGLDSWHAIAKAWRR